MPSEYCHLNQQQIAKRISPVLKLSNLEKRFGDIVAVEDLSIEIPPGEVFGLLGPNGAGKTTTVSMAVGLIEPDKGMVTVDSLGPPTDPEVRSRIGVAPQALAIYEDLSGKENLAFFGRIQGLQGTRLSERVEWALDFVNLSDRRNHRVKTYSGGMKRRLNLAVALIHDPPLLLLDEPTVGVDTQSRNSIFEKIELMRREGRTIVYTTHYMEEAQRLCDRVGIIDHGKLLALDTVQGLVNTYGGKSIITAEREDGEITVEAEDPMVELVRLQDGGRLLRFAVESPGLESVFLNLTGRHLRDN
jgi:ABC-2 type transport system ATP-binding protein